ncbi:MAG: FtsW/RodA/SpoVE family cell cycle protein [bacterium]
MGGSLSLRVNFPRSFHFLCRQIFINIGMNLGMLPIIGIPLPFVSYGGSGLIMFFIGLGVLQNARITKA